MMDNSARLEDPTTLVYSSSQTEEIETMNVTVEWSASLMFAFEITLIVCLMHNIWRYLIKQRRYKSFHIAYFYVLAAMTAVTRAVWFINILVVVAEE